MLGIFKTSEYPEWKVDAEDFFFDDLHHYMDPYFAEVLDEVDALVPVSHRGNAFVCGGFAAHMAGITTESGDVDIFVVQQETFDYLAARIKDNRDVTDRCGGRDKLDLVTSPYGKVLKFRYGDFRFDLVNYTDRIKTPTLLGTLMEFDINWAMAGIDIKDQKIIIHKEALSPRLRVNPERADIYLEGTLHRIPKYQARLRKEPDPHECQAIVEITKRRIKKREKKKGSGSSTGPQWYY